MEYSTKELIDGWEYGIVFIKGNACFENCTEIIQGKTYLILKCFFPFAEISVPNLV